MCSTGISSPCQTEHYHETVKIKQLKQPQPADETLGIMDRAKNRYVCKISIHNSPFSRKIKKRKPIKTGKTEKISNNSITRKQLSTDILRRKYSTFNLRSEFVYSVLANKFISSNPV